MIEVPLSVTAQNTWSAKFRLTGDAANGRQGRCKVGIVQGTTDSTVTLREYDAAGTTVIDSVELTESQIIEIPAGGLWDVGVATGNFGSGTCLITVKQE